MLVQWIGWKEGSETYPVYPVEGVYVGHRTAVTVVVQAAWNLPVDHWSGYDLGLLEAAVRELRRRYDERDKPAPVQRSDPDDWSDLDPSELPRW